MFLDDSVYPMVSKRKGQGKQMFPIKSFIIAALVNEKTKEIKV
jgi:hypothetical protein